MPQILLMEHRLREQDIFNTRCVVEEKDVQLAVNELFAKIFADSFPASVDPEPNRFKVVVHSLGSQRPSDLQQAQLIAPFAFKLYLDVVHQQVPKRPFSEVVKWIMILGKSLKPSINTCVAHRTILNSLDFLTCFPVGHMGTQTDRGLQRLFKKVNMRGDRKSFGKGHKAFSFFRSKSCAKR